jgi:hypothetical protein
MPSAWPASIDPEVALDGWTGPPGSGRTGSAGSARAVGRPETAAGWIPAGGRWRAQRSGLICLAAASDDCGWILGQFALLGRTDVVRALLDAGMPVDTRGWSNFTPLDQAAMHGRSDTVRLLIERGADCTTARSMRTPHAAGLRGVGAAEQPCRGRRLTSMSRCRAFSPFEGD